MSAFVVDNPHIDALLTAGLALNEGRLGSLLRWWPLGAVPEESNRRELTVETADRVGAMLLAENQASVNFRYDEDGLEPVYTFERLRGYDPTRHAWIVLQAIDCYEYQSCEHDGWWSSEALAFCEALRSRIVSSLPAYRGAEGWGISSRDVFQQPMRVR